MFAAEVWAEEVDRLKATSQAHRRALEARTAIERPGARVGLRACEAEAEDGTRLAVCAEVYVPLDREPSQAPCGFVFSLETSTSGGRPMALLLAYIEGDFELGYSQLTDPPDPEIDTRRVLTCANRVPVPFANGAGYCNERVDELFERAGSYSDDGRRVELYGEIQQIVVREQPHILLVDDIGPYAYDADFTGFEDAGAKATYYFRHTA